MLRVEAKEHFLLWVTQEYFSNT